MSINYQRLSIGDRLIRTKGFIFTKHHALYAGYDYENDQHIVAENQRYVGVRIIPLDQFLNEGKLAKVVYNDFSESQQEQVADKIANRLGTAYDVVEYNCEHFVNDVLKDKAFSRQVTIATGVAASAFAVFVLAKKAKEIIFDEKDVHEEGYQQT